jgi:hypothetical protein
MAVHIRVRTVVAVGFFLASVACGGRSSSTPTGPTISSVAGTWVGTTKDSVAGTGNIQVTISQNDAALTGTWASTFADISNNNGGTLGGTISGSSVSVVLTPSDPVTCSFSVTATVSGSSMAGTYATTNCNVAVTGSVSLTKQ